MPVAIITGAARGIGAAAAESLARSGWRVALVDTGGEVTSSPTAPEPATLAQLTTTAELCSQFSPSLAVAADVCSAESVEAAVVTATDQLGPIDAAVAAAGRIAGALAWETPGSAWKELIEVNLFGVRHLAEAVIPGFLEDGGPKRFVGITSASAGKGLAMLAAYGASKSAVTAYIRGLATDLRETKVTANAISPGSTDTEMLGASAEIYGLEGRDSFAHHQLIGRILRPKEVAAAISFLCGPESSGLTGAVIPVDGGMTS